MKRYSGYVTTGLGQMREFEFEVADGATPDEVKDAALRAMLACLEWGYNETMKR